MSEVVRCSTQDRIATVTLTRPDLHNAFNEVVIEDLTQAFAQIVRNRDVRTVVLAAEGKSFCAGADIHWMRRMVDYSFEENVRDANAMADMLRAIRECPKPVVARIHGAAIGGGVGLTAACDIAVAVKTATFCLSEVKLGILPAVISPYVMEKIGPGHLRRYALSAEQFDADEARRIGLIAEVAETVGALDAVIQRFAKSFELNGPEALAACKSVLRDVQQQSSWDEKQRLTVERIAERRVSAEGQDGLKAFLEKRKAKWIE